MVCLSAMQGLGKPGCNMGNLQWGTPVDFNFYFPGYSEGGMSGDLENTAMPVRALSAHAATADHELQRPADPAHLDGRRRSPTARRRAIAGSASRSSISSASSCYPAPGHSPVKMLYKYGGSILGTMNNTNRHVRMYQSEKLEFVVNQSILVSRARRSSPTSLLPACTNFERNRYF